MTNRSHKYAINARIREFTLPPISDGLVLGRDAPIGCVAFKKALALLVTAPFEHIELEDDVVSSLFIRKAVLRRVPQEYLVSFVLKRLKPLMGPEEILHLDLSTEILVEEEGL